MRTTRAIALGGLLLAATEAHAVGVNGAACTPGDPAIQANRYFVSAGSVNYRAGASGPVTLYCPVTVPDDFDSSCPNLQYTMRLTYRDSDGAGDAVSVTAQLLRLSTATGAFLGSPPFAQTIASNASDTTLATSLTAPSFGFSFKEEKEYYYFRVDMNRAAGTSHVATFYGVGLDCTE
ncbi:MAG: hypothetical protein ABW221_27270 [Vicinamibacteria bacterium]